jgi:hypothetical protein
LQGGGAQRLSGVREKLQLHDERRYRRMPSLTSCEVVWTLPSPRAGRYRLPQGGYLMSAQFGALTQR